MKQLKSLIISLIIVISSTGCLAENKVKQVWWVTIKLEATDKVLTNQSVSDFNSEWKYASFLTNQLVKNKITKNEFDDFMATEFTFELKQDLNKNGKLDTVKVGVFKTKENTEGIFLSIFEYGKLIKTLQDNNSKNFSALISHNNVVKWYRCMECGNFETLVWTGSSYFLE